jgi:hypothetical protein
MIIDVLVCNPDGTQVVEQREVPDDHFPPEPEPGPIDELTQIQLALAELAELITGV